MPAIRTKRYPSSAARPTSDVGRYLDALDARLRALEAKTVDRKAAPRRKPSKKTAGT